MGSILFFSLVLSVGMFLFRFISFQRLYILQFCVTVGCVGFRCLALVGVPCKRKAGGAGVFFFVLIASLAHVPANGWSYLRDFGFKRLAFCDCIFASLNGAGNWGMGVVEAYLIIFLFLNAGFVVKTPWQKHHLQFAVLHSQNEIKDSRENERTRECFSS